MSKARFLESFGYAAQGIIAAFRDGRNFKVQVGFAVAAVALGALFGITAEEWLAVIICIGVVLGGECVNTSIEALVDIVQPEQHPSAKTAKDCAAGAVLVASICSLAVGTIVFLPRIFALF